MDKNYKGVVWTNHSIQKMLERGIKQGDAWATFRSPHSSKKANTKGAYIYYKTFGDTRVEVVAKKEQGKWVIVSVWSKKIRKNNKSSKNILLRILKL